MDFQSNIWKMNFAHFFSSMHLTAAVSTLFFIQFGHLDFTQIFFLQSWYMFWIFVLEIPTGVLADRFGRKVVIVLSGFAGAIAALFYGSVPNFYIFMLAEFVWALGASLVSGSDQALIYDTLKKIRKKNLAKRIFSRYTNMSMLSFVFAAPLSSIIAATLGLQAAMLLTAVPFTIGGIISLTLKEPPYKNGNESTRMIRIFKTGLKIIRQNKIIRILAVDTALGFILFYFILWLYQPLFSKSGLDLVYWGVVAGVMNVVGVLALEKVHVLENFFGKKKLIYLTAVIPAMLYILSSFTSSIFLIIPIILSIFALTSIRRPLLNSYMNHYIPSAQRATVVSMAAMMQTILIIIINPFFGMLVDFSLDAALVMLGLAGLSVGIFSKIYVKDEFLKK